MKNENTFIAIDVETAHDDPSSICQIGIAFFENGSLIGEWSSLINPWQLDEEDGYEFGVDAEWDENYEFSNTFVHGITLADVQGAPYFTDVLPKLREFMVDTISVQHTGFDRNALRKAVVFYTDESEIKTTWLDSATVVRRTWNDRRQRGYGLAPVSEMLGFEFDHHDALEDAKAAGNIINHVMKMKGMDINELCDFVGYPIQTEPITREGSEGKFLSGQIIVFTGALSMIRSEAANLVDSLGSKVASSVTKKTTMLIMGDNGEGTGKHKKVMTYVEKGQDIRIMSESDFRTMAGTPSGTPL